MKKAALFLLTGLVLVLGREPLAAKPARVEYLRIADSGWVFELRGQRFRQAENEAKILFNSRSLTSRGVCLFGAPPHPLSLATISVFADLIGDVFHQSIPVRYEGPGIEHCPGDQHIYIRLYQDRPPPVEFNRDLRHLDGIFGIGFPSHVLKPVLTPGQGNSFFGRLGTSVHVMVKQPAEEDLTPMQREFYRSVLVEELYQAFSFGMDILKFDRDTPFYSKLQEYPTFVGNMTWGSNQYMRSVVASNPSGLCGFDIFMLHALARTELETTNSQEFLDFITADFDTLLELAGDTLAKRDYASVLDSDCAEIPE